MAFCSKCGAEIGENESFCPKCGARIGGGNSGVGSSNDTAMGILSYIGILALIPYYSKDQSQFVRFHAVRGMNLFFLELIASGATILFTFALAPLGWVIGWIATAASIVMMIFGILNVCNKEQKDLPVIGGIRFLKD